MYPRYIFLNENDRERYWEIRSFVTSRLMDPETINWALKEDSNTRIKRLVFSDLLEGIYLDNDKLFEPWRSVWEIIVQSWSTDNTVYSDDLSAVDINNRLGSGDRSIALAEEIVKHFKPRLKVEEVRAFGSLKNHKKLKVVADLISLSPVAGRVQDLQYLKSIEGVIDVKFLITLARSLQNAIEDFYYSAYRAGLGDENIFSYIAAIRNVAYCGEDDPDRFADGLEAPVKLFHLIVSRLSIIDKSYAEKFLSSLETKRDNLSIRLWGALVVLWPWVEPKKVGAFLLGLDDHQFWNTSYFPEIAELRASRFHLLDSNTQDFLWAKIRRLPPKEKWYRRYHSSEVNKWRVHAALIETKRIEQNGVLLSPLQASWVQKNLLLYPEFSEIKIIQSPYMNVGMAHWVEPIPDASLDTLSGSDRLFTIEKSLVTTTSRSGAIDWMRQKNNLLFLIDDFLKLDVPAWTYPKTWAQFCSEHKPNNTLYGDDSPRNKDEDYYNILSLMLKMPSDVILEGIQAFTEWLVEWKKYFKINEENFNLWTRMFNIADEAMDRESRDELDQSINIISNDEFDSVKIDSRNYFSPIGRLTEVFIASLPNLNTDPDPFREGSFLLRMRTRLMECTGTSRDIVLCRFAEQLPYLLNVDRLWTKKTIIGPLSTNTEEARGMWESLSHRPLFKKSLEEIGDLIIPPCTDKALGLEARQSLILSVIMEQLNAFREGNREPFISKEKVSQMLYALDDETRAYSASLLTRFISEVSKSKEGMEHGQTPETLFTLSVQPFLKELWPKERSLTSPIVAKAFACLPAATGYCFSVAVDEVERYIQPFGCYSMYDFGFHIRRGGGGVEDGYNSLKKVITTSSTAKSLLHLLDRSIAYTDEPIRPLELADTLSFITTIIPGIEDDPVFLRLSMLSNWR